MLPELVIFDMDGTLTESKSTADAEMIELVKKLLEKQRLRLFQAVDFRASRTISCLVFN